MSVQANKSLIRAMIEQVWNGHQLDQLPEFWTDETRHEAESLHRILTQAFPDLHVNIEDMVAENDRVVLRLSFHGTHQGPFQGIEPTARPVHFTATRFYRIANGKVVDSWANEDRLGLLQQLKP